MAVLVTRPGPDNEATAAALRANGFEAVLAPMLRYEVLPFEDDPETTHDGVIVTSANALRAIADLPLRERLSTLPLFVVGEHTADAARAAGFADVVVDPQHGGASGLPALVEGRLRRPRRGSRAAKAQRSLLYLAGADITRDLSAELGARGFHLVTLTVYRMVAATTLPAAARDAFAADGIEAILHYSRRSAQAFVAAARGAGVEISALALPQCCLSDAVARLMRDAGAAHVTVARATDDASMIEALTRVTRARSVGRSASTVDADRE